mgnify:CR=1 FL=1|tara:strand:- start:186655 stop:187857 length:1203 start_codon:yes stop_codon:yes gene_type:complete
MRGGLNGGISRIDVLLFIGVTLIGFSLLLPQLQAYRENARARSCGNNLARIGIALNSYHDSHLGFPPGYFPADYTTLSDGTSRWRSNEPSYSWAAFLLPFLDFGELYADLRVDDAGLSNILSDRSRWSLVEQKLPVFSCPSDRSGETMASSPLRPTFRVIDRRLDRGSDSPSGGSSSYVGSGGYFELNHPLYSVSNRTPQAMLRTKTGENNGLFYVASHVHRRQIVDGLSSTIAIGERAWFQGGASWVGIGNVRGVASGDTGTCLGRVYWKINEIPTSTIQLASEQIPVFVTPENNLTVPPGQSSRNGFGSYHPNGANFLLADGSVRFVGNGIDFVNTISMTGADPSEPIPDIENLGVFQRLGIRNDSFQAEPLDSTIGRRVDNRAGLAKVRLERKGTSK